VQIACGDLSEGGKKSNPTTLLYSFFIKPIRIDILMEKE
jgi:hypothetical protein